MKKVKKPLIIYPRGAAASLAQHYGVTQHMVRRALKFETDSDIANTIREDCIKNYGGKLSEQFI